MLMIDALVVLENKVKDFVIVNNLYLSHTDLSLQNLYDVLIGSDLLTKIKVTEERNKDLKQKQYEMSKAVFDENLLAFLTLVLESENLKTALKIVFKSKREDENLFILLSKKFPEEVLSVKAPLMLFQVND